MKKYVCTFLSIILLVAVSCQQETELTDELKATIEKEVEAQHDKLANAIRQLDIDLQTPNISKEFISHISGSRGITYGYDACIDSFKNSFANRTRHQSQVLDQKITVLSSDLVLLTSESIWENWFKDGRYRKSNGKATYLYKKEPDGWKVIHTHESGLVLEESTSE